MSQIYKVGEWALYHSLYFFCTFGRIPDFEKEIWKPKILGLPCYWATEVELAKSTTVLFNSFARWSLTDSSHGGWATVGPQEGGVLCSSQGGRKASATSEQGSEQEVPGELQVRGERGTREPGRGCVGCAWKERPSAREAQGLDQQVWRQEAPYKGIKCGPVWLVSAPQWSHPSHGSFVRMLLQFTRSSSVFSWAPRSPHCPEDASAACLPGGPSLQCPTSKVPPPAVTDSRPEAAIPQAVRTWVLTCLLLPPSPLRGNLYFCLTSYPTHPHISLLLACPLTDQAVSHLLSPNSLKESTWSFCSWPPTSLPAPSVAPKYGLFPLPLMSLQLPCPGLVNCLSTVTLSRDTTHSL